MSREKSSWLKGHPLEGDGTLVNLFHYLWKKNRDLQSCPLVRVPSTIVYEHNFPRGWYVYDAKHSELRKKTGKELDTNSIFREFSKAEDENESEIVASYLSKMEDEETGEEITSVEFFDKNDLNTFLFKREKREQGILQKFVTPKGSFNSVIQAIWSPHVTLVERRNNIHKLNDKKWTMYERAVTYEGPAHYSNEVFCAPQLVQQIKEICQSFVNHFSSTEHKNITRMVLYFKVDNKSNVWLLWSSSVRISDKQLTTSLSRTIPLNLSPKFTSPDENKPTNPLTHHTAASKEQVKQNEVESPAFICPNCGNSFESGYERFEIPLEKVVKYFNQHRAYFRRTGSFELPHSSSTPKRSGTPTSVSAQSNLEGIDADHENHQENAASTNGNSSSNSQNSAELEALKERHSLIVEHLDDLLYEAYSHFLSSSEPFYFKLPAILERECDTHLKELFTKLKIQKVQQDDGGDSTEEDDNAHGDQWFIPNQHISIGKLQKDFQHIKEAVKRNLYKELTGKEGPDGESNNNNNNISEVDKVAAKMDKMELTASASPVNRALTPLKQENFGTWTSSPRIAEATNVPPLLRKFLPDLTNEGYKKLCAEPLFLSRNIELCEKCFLLFTESDGIPGSPSGAKLGSPYLRQVAHQEKRRFIESLEDKSDI